MIYNREKAEAKDFATKTRHYERFVRLNKVFRGVLVQELAEFHHKPIAEVTNEAVKAISRRCKLRAFSLLVIEDEILFCWKDITANAIITPAVADRTLFDYKRFRRLHDRVN